MFGKKVHIDIKKSAQKINDVKKDVQTRYKHLKNVLEHADCNEAKLFFECNYSNAYHVFYDHFATVETNLKQKAHKAHKEELECVLFVLERILLLCPELIRNRWQCHSLSHILKKLLHPANSWKLRREAIRLFILWYQALGDSAPESATAIFATLVPEFSNPFQDQIGLDVISTPTLYQTPVYPVEICPIYPAPINEKLPEDPCKFFLEALLEFMVTEVSRIKWNDPGENENCFIFLFEMFKKFYLPSIFPDYSNETDVYNPCLVLPVGRSTQTVEPDKFYSCRVSMVKWVANFTYDAKGQFGERRLGEQSDFYGKAEGGRDPLTVSIDIARKVLLFGSRERLNFVHEVYRQAFLLNFSVSPAIRRTIAVYKDWIQSNAAAEEGKNNNHLNPDPQNVIQLFIVHSVNVFLLENDGECPILLEEQVDTCKRVLNMYRFLVMHIGMEPHTWHQLLLALLRITSILAWDVPKRKDRSLPGRLASAIFQTLIVTWIKANLNVVISVDLWDQFVEMLTSLTRWEELICEWAKTMETLTRVLARQVYGLDLQDLPLDRLTEKKSKRKLGFSPGKKASLGRNGTCPEPDDGKNGEKGEEEYREISSERRFTFQSLDGNVAESREPLFMRRAMSDFDIAYNEDELKLAANVAKKKWHSLDSLKKCSDKNFRTPSPAPSDRQFLKEDSPLQLDVLSGNEESTGEGKSVMAGGKVRGWTPDVASVLWKRMLCSLGNFNGVSDPVLHAQIFHHLIDLLQAMIKIRANQGVSMDGKPPNPPAQPELTPPLTIFAPWCFQALDLDDSYQRGKLCSYKLLCQMTLNDGNLSIIHVAKFYAALRRGLASGEKSVVYTIMKHAALRFFSRQLPGSQLLVRDFVGGAELVLQSRDLGLTPRTEAATMLCSLLTITSDMEGRIVSILVEAGKTEPSGSARCTILSALAVFLLRELQMDRRHILFEEAFDVLLVSLRFNHEVVAQVACDLLVLFYEKMDQISRHFPRMPIKVAHVLVQTLNGLTPVEDGKKRLLTSLLFALGEWAMHLSREELNEHGKSGKTLLHSIFKVLCEFAHGGRNKCDGSLDRCFSAELMKEFDPNLALDNLKESYERQDRFSNTSPKHSNSTRHSIRLAAKFIIAHLVNHLGQFPITTGAARLSSLVAEQDDVKVGGNKDVFSSKSMQMFVSTSNSVMSVMELPMLEVPGGGVTAELFTGESQVRILTRNLNGKFCWDATILYAAPDQISALSFIRNEEEEKKDEDSSMRSKKRDECKEEEEEEFPFYAGSDIGNKFLSAQRHTFRHRCPGTLPTVENSAPDLDNLNDLLQYIAFTSPECLEDAEMPLNVSCPTSPFEQELEEETIGGVVSHRFLERDYLNRSVVGVLKAAKWEKPLKCALPREFRYCGLWLWQMGFLGSEYRRRLYLVQRTEKFLREVRNLDSQAGRETHKIAVIYVAEGQEDKASILANESGSQEYEDFVAALGWEVDLDSHTGFMGGLKGGKDDTGAAAPYYADSFCEMILHVSTRMNSSTQEDFINKTRHLGNDEVHIVWSEHHRDYRRGIIPTEFCDILIVIYPLQPGRTSFRLQISRKSCEVAHFGPFISEMIVDGSILPSFVRWTAINASRGKRSALPFHQQHYEERFRSLETAARDYKTKCSFEDFIAQVYSPTFPEPTAAAMEIPVPGAGKFLKNPTELNSST